MADSRRPNILSIDGGGVRGLSALIILQHLMDRLNQSRKDKGLEPQEPWQTFQLIGGTSTGGIIAVMLGRLRMSIVDCRAAYETLSRQSFTPLHSKVNVVASAIGLWSADAAFDVKELEKSIRQVIKENLKHGESDPDFALLKEDDAIDQCGKACKVFVACTHQDIAKLAIFRSYLHPTKVRRKVVEKCLIWQACRATSAAPTFFPPIDIDGQIFLDGGLVNNNPVHIAYEEARSLWPTEEPLLISIGTGDAPMEEFGKTLVQVVKSLKNIATETGETANVFLESDTGRAMTKDGRYFRFNVPNLGRIGLEEWKATGTITTLTEHYLDRGEMAPTTAACVQKLSETISRVEAEEERRKMAWLSARGQSFPVAPKSCHIAVEKFQASNEGVPDTDYPGRYYYYREDVDVSGYPPDVKVDTHCHDRGSRPVSNSIITCRRTCNLQIRGQDRWIIPGRYRTIWIFWFVAGPKYSPTNRPSGFIPEIPQKNSLCERFFPSTLETEAPPKLDSSFFYPWPLICSVGRPKRYQDFLYEEFDLDKNPLAAKVLLLEGFKELHIDPGMWNTIRNTGWYKVPGPIVDVANDGELAFVISKPWERKWVGGFSFGGVSLEPV